MSKEIKNILVTGAAGQIGTELTLELRKKYGAGNVLATDLKPSENKKFNDSGEFLTLDVTDLVAVEEIVKKRDIDTVVHLAALLSGTGEVHPDKCWHVNMNGTMNILQMGVKYNFTQVFMPSSIAVWGPDCPKLAPQDTALHPTTMYGVTKVCGELISDYFSTKLGLDCRGLRFPGIISAETLPGGGTTDYAVEIFYKAVLENHYKCFLKAETRLPMMYMPDCIKSVLDLMAAPYSNLTRHGDYNVGSMTFDAATLANSIKKYRPDFTIEYVPDFRQEIADSWPDDVDDTPARNDWGWSPSFDLDSMTRDMLEKLEKKLKI